MRLKLKSWFQAEMHAMRTFHFEIHKTADCHSSLLVSSELGTKGYQGGPMKCAHFTQFNEMHDRKTMYGNSSALLYIYHASSINTIKTQTRFLFVWFQS